MRKTLVRYCVMTEDLRQVEVGRAGSRSFADVGELAARSPRLFRSFKKAKAAFLRSRPSASWNERLRRLEDRAQPGDAAPRAFKIVRVDVSCSFPAAEGEDLSGAVYAAVGEEGHRLHPELEPGVRYEVEQAIINDSSTDVLLKGKGWYGSEIFRNEDFDEAWEEAVRWFDAHGRYRKYGPFVRDYRI